MPEALEGYLQNEHAFMEVWLYTGYYSSLDGNDAEYNICALKISEEQEGSMREYVVKNNNITEGGITFV